MGMKSTLTIAVTVAVISSMVTYRIVATQSGPKDIYRENEGEKSSILPRETNPESGPFRLAGPRPLQHAPTAPFGSTSQPRHAEATSTPPPPLHELHLQDSPDLIAQEKERKEEREKHRRELIQSMKDNGLPEEHIRQMEQHMFMDLPPVRPEFAEEGVPEKTPTELANDLVKSSVESNMPAEHQQRMREAAEQMTRFAEEQEAKVGNAPNPPPLPPSP